MPRVIPAEAMAFLTGALDEGAMVGIRVTGVDPTPEGPRIRFDVPRMRRRRGDTRRLPDREAIAELVSRMVALRWKDSPEPRAISEHHQMDLAADHPQVIGDFTETGPGWHWLLSATASWIEETGIPEGFVASQIKEKFGTLRFYWCATGNELQANRIIEAAEWISGAVCETCGAPGRTRPGGWIKTACDAHARKR
ncbi:hypothetical protein LNAOJCKE_4665 [Methylorubrum aminovorans]|uniref:Uncharacterized protein n=1 Tax=Methylorubrum aminovorans TaxID=269069 RepID=A0ABQ4UJK2_9HYPH|nr:hypothetical protein [Methylorubrum aminovorans]GJE67434.1 hypothetical protein LNAOJCKE_4665 [Methylorubrum aminovorans]GMA74788.1 hypothetical protein GCM10025880_12050 [Methylorubrum aminovorans]